MYIHIHTHTYTHRIIHTRAAPPPLRHPLHPVSTILYDYFILYYTTLYDTIRYYTDTILHPYRIL